jgi:hypothetical protein
MKERDDAEPSERDSFLIDYDAVALAVFDGLLRLPALS